jgi:N-acetylglutamate synthase-like GNAT family acetyltransferase
MSDSEDFRMRIRPASTDDAEGLTEIAVNAKRHWGYPEHWIEHWKSDLTISPEFIAHNQVFVAEDEGELIGFYALSVESKKAELDHMWVSPNHIGTGIGKELFVHAMQRAAGQGLEEVEIIADPHAEGFYQRWARLVWVQPQPTEKCGAVVL